jgi:hypothetical protein
MKANIGSHSSSDTNSGTLSRLLASMGLSIPFCRLKEGRSQGLSGWEANDPTLVFSANLH